MKLFGNWLLTPTAAASLGPHLSPIPVHMIQRRASLDSMEDVLDPVVTEEVWGIRFAFAAGGVWVIPWHNLIQAQFTPEEVS